MPHFIDFASIAGRRARRPYAKFARAVLGRDDETLAAPPEVDTRFPAPPPPDRAAEKRAWEEKSRMFGVPVEGPRLKFDLSPEEEDALNRRVALTNRISDLEIRLKVYPPSTSIAEARKSDAILNPMRRELDQLRSELETTEPETKPREARLAPPPPPVPALPSAMPERGDMRYQRVERQWDQKIAEADLAHRQRKSREAGAVQMRPEEELREAPAEPSAVLPARVSPESPAGRPRVGDERYQFAVAKWGKAVADADLEQRTRKAREALGEPLTLQPEPEPPGQYEPLPPRPVAPTEEEALGDIERRFDTAFPDADQQSRAEFVEREFQLKMKRGAPGVSAVENEPEGVARPAAPAGVPAVPAEPPRVEPEARPSLLAIEARMRQEEADRNAAAMMKEMPSPVPSAATGYRMGAAEGAKLPRPIGERAQAAEADVRKIALESGDPRLQYLAFDPNAQKQLGMRTGEFAALVRGATAGRKQAITALHAVMGIVDPETQLTKEVNQMLRSTNPKTRREGLAIVKQLVMQGRTLVGAKKRQEFGIEATAARARLAREDTAARAAATGARVEAGRVQRTAQRDLEQLPRLDPEQIKPEALDKLLDDAGYTDPAQRQQWSDWVMAMATRGKAEREAKVKAAGERTERANVMQGIAQARLKLSQDLAAARDEVVRSRALADMEKIAVQAYENGASATGDDIVEEIAEKSGRTEQEVRATISGRVRPARKLKEQAAAIEGRGGPQTPEEEQIVEGWRRYRLLPSQDIQLIREMAGIGPAEAAGPRAAPPTAPRPTPTPSAAPSPPATPQGADVDADTDIATMRALLDAIGDEEGLTDQEEAALRADPVQRKTELEALQEAVAGGGIR